MIVNPSQVYQLSKTGSDWALFQTLSLQDTSLTFSGTGTIYENTIFQLAYDAMYCYGIFFEPMPNGTWQQTQTLQLSISSPCAEVDSYSQVSVAINKGIAAVMYNLQNSGNAELGILTINEKGIWSQSASFPLTSYFYFTSPMVAIGDGIVAVQVMTQNYTSATVKKSRFFFSVIVE